MRPLICLVLAFLFSVDACAAEPFEIKDGDRVLFLGDTLLEREGTYGYLETRMHEQFPDRRLTVRNLSFSGDTPRGWSRASFDPAEKGFERLKEQIATVRPTVVFLGYGMAASLQEMTDRAGDPTLNPDPARYGAESMSAERFKRELGELMDAIGKDVRFVLLSPIRHEDLRATRPGLPDPARHNELLAQYTKAIDELAGEKRAIHIPLTSFPAYKIGTLPFGAPDPGPQRLNLTDNGIHPTEMGYRNIANGVFEMLGYAAEQTTYEWPTGTIGYRGVTFLGPAPGVIPPAKVFQLRKSFQNTALRAAIVRKNELFFHQWRPANSTYLFGFRKHEQGQNAKEMPMFDPLIAAAEAEIDRLKRVREERSTSNVQRPTSNEQTTAAATPIPTPATSPLDVERWKLDVLPKPDFTVAEGYEIALWAENPLLYKPTQMNWDAQGRLWVASSALYPQIAPGGTASDSILILEDTDRDGRAEKSTVFTDGLLIPTAVQPAFVSSADGKTRFGCYVGQSTELLYFEDTDGDGRADRRQIIHSGFGTEDTHHIIHTLKWGPDGRLYFNQSVYIHSHIETPWGLVRLNSGGVFAWDPRTEKLEVYAKGLWNTWGLQFDKWGQSFQTDGAGSTGITWSFPGATFAPFEGARRTMPSISPGAYPKFCGLEILYSPHFPADWQGNAITCDFRAHRIVRFGITDLAEGATPQAGYTTQEMPDLVRTSDVSFRPIDVKLGPDGALYIADWSNPVINHGEVDFRDPRRDKTHGRIWRISRKDAPVVKWEPLALIPLNPEKHDRKNSLPVNAPLLDKLFSQNQWDREQSRHVLLSADETTVAQDTGRWLVSDRLTTGRATSTGPQDIEVLRLRIGLGLFPSNEIYGVTSEVTVPAAAATGARYLGQYEDLVRRTTEKVKALAASHPRDDKEHRDRQLIMSQSGWLLNKSPLHTLVDHPHPRVRLEAVRALARIPHAESASLVLDAAVPKSEIPNPKSEISTDPFLDFAAWQSINDLAKPWTAAIASGEWKIEGRERQLEYGLNAIDPALAGATLALLLKDGKISLNKGPWIELIGKAGGPAELAAVFESMIISFGADCCSGRNMIAPRATSFSEAEALRGIAALLEAVRVRNVRPDGELSLADLATHAPSALRPGFTRLAGYWKTADAPEFLPAIAKATDVKAELRLAAIEGLRALGGNRAETELAGLSGEQTAHPFRREAALALASLNTNRGLLRVLQLLWVAKSEDEALALWRDVLKVQGAADKLAKIVAPDAATSLPPGNVTTSIGDVVAMPNDKPLLPLMPKTVALAGVRAAREGGRKTQSLFQVLSGLAGVSAVTSAPANYAEIAARAKRDGDPAQGEIIYRRAASGCVTCHAIGGAGGLVGPALTSIGASAPLDYLIESMLAPNAKVKEGYNAVTLKLKDGTEATGIAARETAQELVLRNIAGQETAVPKASITGRSDVGSIMPAGLLDALGERDRLNLYAFLSELGKPGPYDASKGSVARVWRLYSGSQEARALQQDLTDYTPSAFTNVDGRLLRDALAEALPLLGDDAPTFFATVQFQVATAGKVRFALAGVHSAWLDGQPLAIASEPNPAPELAPGTHTLAVKLDRTALPAILRTEAEGVRFLGN